MAAGGQDAKWLGLLKWSMKYQDGTHPTDFSKMKPEDKEWLERVMKECVIDEVERMTHIIRILDGESPKDVFELKKEEIDETVMNDENELAAYREELMEELLTRVDQIDNAQNFVKIRGTHVVIKLLDHERPTTRAMAAEVLATVVQNNPPCQKAVMELNGVEKFSKLLSDEDSMVQAKGLLALSSLIRGVPEAEKMFLKGQDAIDGIEMLKKVLQAENERVKVKALFFLRYLMNSHKENAQLIHEGRFFVPFMKEYIGHTNVDLAEGSLAGLFEYINQFDECKNECLEHEHSLLDTLEQRKGALGLLSGEDMEYAQMELELLEELLKALKQ